MQFSTLFGWPLMIGATILTAFNDNAAVTYLASLVPGFSDALKYVVMAGAVTGAGLTVIANSPNPAGQSLLASPASSSVAQPIQPARGTTATQEQMNKAVSFSSRGQICSTIAAGTKTGSLQRGL